MDLRGKTRSREPHPNSATRTPILQNESWVGSGANLYDANLVGADLTDANPTRANLSYSDGVAANLQSADLTEANLWYAYWDGAFLDCEPDGREPHWHQAPACDDDWHDTEGNSIGGRDVDGRGLLQCSVLLDRECHHHLLMVAFTVQPRIYLAGPTKPASTDRAVL